MVVGSGIGQIFTWAVLQVRSRHMCPLTLVEDNQSNSKTCLSNPRLLFLSMINLVVLQYCPNYASGNKLPIS